MSIVTSLKLWFDRMRRRYFGRFGSTVAVTPTPTPLPSLGTLSLSATTFTRGVTASGSILGATVFSAITASGLPSGLTIDSAARTWAWDGTGSGSAAGSFALTETLVGYGNTPHPTIIGYSIAAAASLSAPTIAFDSGNGWTTGQNPPALAITLPDDGSVQLGDWYRIEHSQDSFSTSLFTAWTQITSDDVINSIEAGGYTFTWDTVTLPTGSTSFRLFFGRGADAAHITLQSVASNVITDTLTSPAPANLLSNGTFADTSVWTIGGGNGSTTISGGVLNCTGNSGMCYQPITYVSGGTYQLDLDYTCTVGAKLRVNLSNASGADTVIVSGALTVDGASHHLTLTFTANVTSGYLNIEADSNLFTGTIDNAVLIRTA